MQIRKPIIVALTVAVSQIVEAIPTPKSTSIPIPTGCDPKQRIAYVSDALQSYAANSASGNGVTSMIVENFWSGQGWINYNTMESLLNAAAFYPNQTYKNSDFQLSSFVIDSRKNTLSPEPAALWNRNYGSFGTDDYGWKALLALAAHRMADTLSKDSSDSKDWLHKAQDTYDKYLAPYWDNSTGGGGVMWKMKGADYRATISTELYLTVAAQLYDAGCGDQYLQDAKKAYQWLVVDFKAIRNGDAGLFYDGYTPPKKDAGIIVGQQLYTYNQGVILSGLGYLYKSTKDSKYMEDGLTIIGAMYGKNGMTEGEGKLVIRDKCDQDDIDGLTSKNNGNKKADLDNCSEDQDYFKGAFMKHMTYFLRLIPKERASAYANFVQENANAAWSARISDLTFSNVWIETGTSNFNKLKDNIGVSDSTVFDALVASIDFGNPNGC